MGRPARLVSTLVRCAHSAPATPRCRFPIDRSRLLPQRDHRRRERAREIGGEAWRTGVPGGAHHTGSCCRGCADRTPRGRQSRGASRGLIAEGPAGGVPNNTCSSGRLLCRSRRPRPGDRAVLPIDTAILVLLSTVTGAKVISTYRPFHPRSRQPTGSKILRIVLNGFDLGLTQAA